MMSHPSRSHPVGEQLQLLTQLIHTLLGPVLLTDSELVRPCNDASGLRGVLQCSPAAAVNSSQGQVCSM